MKDKIFINSNILLYTFDANDEKKQQTAKSISLQKGISISIQVINEVNNNLIRKFSFSNNQAKQFIESCYKRYQVFGIAKDTLMTACDIRDRYNISYYDSLIISSALESECTVLYSEDMKHNLKIGKPHYNKPIFGDKMINFEKYPFEKLNELLKGIKPPKGENEISLTIGEPQFETPQFIQDELSYTSKYLKKYPKTAGENELRYDLKEFVKRRYNIELKDDEIVATFGTREVLFNFPQFYLFDKPNPVMAFPNPFYQIYEGAAIASKAKIIHLNLNKENDFKPNSHESELKNCDLVIINSPNNPTASLMSLDELKIWAELALKYDFMLINDECYSEIYFDKKPHSLLEASIAVGNKSFKNILVLNSISKRSSAPGLRSGYVAGDSEVLKEYAKYRTYVGCASPLPLQYAAAIAWSDEKHVEVARAKYKKNMKLANEILKVKAPESTFYIWLEVKDDEEFAKKLYEMYAIKVLPGSYLGRGGVGKNYVRIALVYDTEITREALEKIQKIREDV